MNSIVGRETWGLQKPVKLLHNLCNMFFSDEPKADWRPVCVKAETATFVMQ
jgi:hypothetical protein